MNRRVLGWLLLSGSPRVATTTLVLAVGLKRAFNGPPLRAADLVVIGAAAAAAVGTAGAYLVTAQPTEHVLRILGAGAAGAAIPLPCVYVAERVFKWF